jgi:translation initiation factor 2 alpha subunit (eIF-2alpha)
LEVMKVDGDNIDLTNRNTGNKQDFMALYRKAHSVHMIAQYVASKIQWEFSKFLEKVIYPLYNGEHTAYTALSDDAFRQSWFQTHIPEHVEICWDNFNKLFATKKIKPAPIILSLCCYEPDGVERIKKFGLDSELALENEGIAISFERISDKYRITIDQKEMEPEEYEVMCKTIRKILGDLSGCIQID